MEGAIFMSDTNDILRKLAAQAGGEAALSALERALSSADGRPVRCPCARTQPRRHSGGRKARRRPAPQHGRVEPWITMPFPAC